MARRALLGQFPLGTRHAHFQVCVHVHELIHVPLLSGEFSLDWHIKHSVGHARKTLASLSSVDEDHDDGHERATTIAQENDPVHAQDSPEWSPAVSSSADPERRRGAWTAPIDTELARTPPRPSTPESTPHPHMTESPELLRSSAAARDDANTTLRPSDTLAVSDDASAHVQAPARRMRPRTRSNTSSNAGSSIFAVVPHHTASGQTPFLGVQAQSVQWDTRIESVVRMGVGRPEAESETKDSDSIRSSRSESSSAGRLRSSRIRLRVYRRQADEGHTDSRQKFGSFSLDLAEYAPRLSSAPGSHTRRESRQFLLDHCSCNALLRLTIDVTYLDGTQAYIVPSIQKGMLDPASLQSGERGMRSPVPGSGSDLSSASTNLANEPGQGLEWHCRLPLPLLYHNAIIKPEFVHHDDSHTFSSLHPNSLVHSFSHDASQPRHTYCRMNSAALIDDLFGGLLGPLEDQRSDDAHVPMAQPHRRRMRWRQLLPNASTTPKSASSDEVTTRAMARTVHRRSGEQLRKHGRPLPFRMRPDEADSS